MLEVIDRDGSKHDMAWLQPNYGSGICFYPAEGYPRFELQKIFITEGPTVLRFTVLLADGTPAVGQPAAYSYPSLGSPSGALPALPAGADKSGWFKRACVERCNPRGEHEFEIGKDSWIKGIARPRPWLAAVFEADPAFGFYDVAGPAASGGVSGRGPYAVAVISPSTYSDCLDGIGWLGGTNHRGPCEFVFREVIQKDDDGGGGSGGTADVAHLHEDLHKLAAHLGLTLPALVPPGAPVVTPTGVTMKPQVPTAGGPG